MSVSHAASCPKVVLYPAGAFSLFVALIHFWVMPEHFEEWWGYGAFFLVAAVTQGAYGIVLLRWPSQPMLLLGVVGNSSVIFLYLLTRTVGIPSFGPGAGEVEENRARRRVRNHVRGRACRRACRTAAVAHLPPEGWSVPDHPSGGPFAVSSLAALAATL